MKYANMHLSSRSYLSSVIGASLIVLSGIFSDVLRAQDTSKDAELDTVTVKGDKHEVTAIEKASTSTTVTSIDIEQKSSKLLKDTLTQMPGIQVETQRKGTKTFYMRGYSQDKVAITVDGVPVIDTYSGSIDIDNIGLLDVSEIVVQRGTSSALFGTRGTVGAINIYKAPPDRMYAKAGAEVDHLGNHFMNISHGARFGDFYYMLSGSYDKSFGYTISSSLTRSKRLSWIEKLTSIDWYGYDINTMYQNANKGNAVKYYIKDKGRWDHTNHLKFKLNAKVGYFITPDLEAGLTGFFNRTKMENSTYHTDCRSFWGYNYDLHHGVWVSPSTDNAVKNQSNVWPAYNDWSISPFVNWKAGRFSCKVKGWYYSLNNKYVSYLDPDEIVPNTGTSMDAMSMTWSYWTNRTFGFAIHPSYKLSDMQKLSMSIQWYRNSHIEEERYFDSGAQNIIKDFGKSKYKTMEISANYFTLAFEDEIKINSYTDISAGISYDSQDLTTYQKYTGKKYDPHYGNTYKMVDMYQAKDKAMLFGTRDSFNPVLGIVSEPLKDFLKWRASVSYKTSFPSLRAYSKIQSNRQYESSYTNDTHVKPEKSLNGNLGGELSFFGKSLVAASDFFYSYYQDKIIRSYLTQINDYIYRNIKASYLTGLESSLTYNRYDIFDMVDMSVGFTHTYSYSRSLYGVHNSSINKGKRFEFQPVHKFTVDYRAVFPKTDTSFFLFGYFEYNTIFYTMRGKPESHPTVMINGKPYNHIYSTKWFKPTRLNNPLMIDAKVSQKFYLFDDYELEAYILCKNIFDDYLADPFNPGPGRTWCLGVKVAWN